MPAPSSTARKPARISNVAVAVALFTPRDGALAVLLVPVWARSNRGKDRWSFPSDLVLAEETLDDAAARIARGALGATPTFLDQAVASVGTRVVGAQGQVTITYFGLAPDSGAVSSPGASWVPTNDAVSLATRLTGDIDAAIAAMRARVDQQPIAFKLLPPTFTLSELQSVYELLLGRRLHKASFRRSRHASALVEATDEWRSEGRGRPAQLFRYAPPRRRRRRRGIRFDLLS
jgi:8-oxo-dGTP diphosphatase